MNNNNFSMNMPMMSKKDLENINVEILALEELMLACLTKETSRIVSNIDDLYALCSNIVFYKSVFLKMIYIYQANMHCVYSIQNNFFSREEESLLIKVHAYHIDNLDIQSILAKHRRLSYILFMQKQLNRFADEVTNSNIQEADIYNFLSDMQSAFDSRFDFIDNRIITPYNLKNFIDELFFDQADNIIATGYKDLDYHIGGGMRVGDIVVIAAQPGTAKTMMCLNIFCNNIEVLKKDGKKVLYFCPDMHLRYVYRRIWSMHTGLPQTVLKHTEKNKIIEDMTDLPLITSESSNLEDIIRIINYYNKQIKVVMIDYVQLIYSNKYSSHNKHEQIAKIIAELKKVVREHNILLILVSQINREATKAQQISITHLKDSSALEQDSDIVFLLSNISDPEEQYGAAPRTLIKLSLGKNRHGRQNVSFNFVMNKENFKINYDKKEEIKTRNFKTDDSVSIE